MKIIPLSPDQLVWPAGTLGGQPSPCYRIGSGSYKSSLYVHPRPCYRADAGVVEQLVAECVDRFPLRGAASAELYLLPHDFQDGFNGITMEDTVWKRPDGSSWEEDFPHRNGGEPVKRSGGQAHCIIIAGKAIPHHPAMLRYLVAHEYGHAVFNHLVPRLGYHQNERGELERTYMALRGVADVSDVYTAGQWHRSPGEIIANDFRVLVMGREREFWPHPGVPEANADSAIVAWWRKAFEACGLKPRFA